MGSVSSIEKTAPQRIFNFIDNREYEVKRLFEYLAFREVREIRDTKDLRKGDHIVLYSELNGVKHLQHLIVAFGSGTFVKGYGFVRPENHAFPDPRQQRIVSAVRPGQSGVAIYKVVYPRYDIKYEGEDAVRRAEAFFHCKSYAGSSTHERLFNNDEHFATWCISGDAQSKRSVVPYTALSGAALGGVAGATTAAWYKGATVNLVLRGALTGASAGLVVGLTLGIAVSYFSNVTISASPKPREEDD